MKWLFSYMFLLFVCTACTDRAPSARKQWMTEKDILKVLCTTEQVAHLVRLVGKEHVAVYTLIPPTSDPHTYQVRRGDGELFLQADILFFSGLGLEHTSQFAVYTQLPKAVCIGEAIQKICSSEVIMSGNAVDPHIWMDVALWSRGIDCIEEALKKAIPDASSELEKNAQEGKKQLLLLHQRVCTAIHRLLPSVRYLVTTHDAFRYFTRAYFATEEERVSGSWTERCRAPEGIAPESQISLRELGMLVTYIEKYNIRMLFPEYGINRDSLHRLVDVCREDGMRVELSKKGLYSDALGAIDGYEAMILEDTRIIVEGLSGT